MQSSNITVSEKLGKVNYTFYGKCHQSNENLGQVREAKY